MKHLAKKSLGQHFLFNPSTIDKILRVAKVTPTDKILEIGPGPGRMTRRLAEQVQQLVAVEKDHRLAARLQEEFKESHHAKIIEADFLELEFEKELQQGKWKVVANLPYNIATEVIFHLLDRHFLFESFYLMVQKEVAERLTARPGSKNYGILSVFSQIFSENRIVMRLPPGAFSPPPKVDSALVEFQVHEIPRFDIHHLPTFESVIQAAFSQRRKMIRNSLRAQLTRLPAGTLDQALSRAQIRPTDRAETVPIAQFVALANNLSSQSDLV